MERWESRASVPFPPGQSARETAFTWLLVVVGLPVVAGYAGLAVLLSLPLLVLRRRIARPAATARAA